MKKISFIAFVLSASLAVCAQNTTTTTRTTTFGIKAGVNLAEFRVHDYPAASEPSVNLKTSMHGGFFVNAPLGTGGFAVQPELLYSGQGSKMNVPTTVGTVTNRTKYEQDLSYITLPIMLQWKSAGGFYVETGPQPGYLIRGKQDGPDNTEMNNKDNFDNFDFAWGAGLGFASRMGLGIGARYNYGLTNTIEDGGGNNSANDGPELKNSVIMIGLSWRFGANK
jgi:hypothetical protein